MMDAMMDIEFQLPFHWLCFTDRLREELQKDFVILRNSMLTHVQ